MVVDHERNHARVPICFSVRFLGNAGISLH
jgi:hypothetical protein